MVSSGNSDSRRESGGGGIMSGSRYGKWKYTSSGCSEK